MDNWPTNVSRAASAESVLSIFADERGLEGEDAATQISDLVCNLMHLCDVSGIDAFNLIERSVGLYASECVAENDLGPDIFATVLLDGKPPSEALRSAKDGYRQAITGVRAGLLE